MTALIAKAVVVAASVWDEDPPPLPPCSAATPTHLPSTWLCVNRSGYPQAKKQPCARCC
jgi:hypothetical protein